MFRKKTKAPTKEGRWSSEEHQRFLQGMMIYGRRWTKVADIVATRNTVQVYFPFRAHETCQPHDTIRYLRLLIR